MTLRRQVTGPLFRIAHIAAAPEFVTHIMIHDLRRLRGTTEPTVICSDGPGLEQVRAEGFQVVTLPLRRKMAPLADLVAVWRLWRLLSRERFDLVHTYTPKAGLLGQLAAYLAGIPNRVHSCRGLLYVAGLTRLRKTLFRLTDRLTWSLAARTIFVSRADQEYAVREGLCDSSRTRCTGSGVDLRYFAPHESRMRVSARRDLGLSADHFVFLTIGRFVGDKGYRELAEAAAVLWREDPRVRFVWLAPVMGNEEDVLPDSLRADWGLTDVVIQLPYRSDPRPLYAAADALVHPSYREGVPRVVMEAAAMGLPIVASDIPGCREVITPGVTGLLFRPGDSQALLRALRAMMQDPHGARTRAHAARDLIRRRFDQDSLTDRIWSVYKELVGSSTEVVER